MFCPALNPVPDEHLKFLNAWPEGNPLHDIEQCNIKLLNTLCNQYGYGRIPQLAAMLEELWRDSEKLEVFKKIQQDRFDELYKERGLTGSMG